MVMSMRLILIIATNVMGGGLSFLAAQARVRIGLFDIYKAKARAIILRKYHFDPQQPNQTASCFKSYQFQQC